MPTLTPKLNLQKPADAEFGWQNMLRQNSDVIDAEALRIATKVDPQHNPDGTHTALTTDDVVVNGTMTLGGVARNTFPASGGSTAALTDVFVNGEKGNIPAAGEFEIRNNAGTVKHFGVDEVTGKVTAINLAGMFGNIMSPLVHIPFKRQNDEVALSGTQTFTRASTGTYIDPLDGLIKTAAINTPRFERMADGGTGILLEGGSTNTALQSEDLTSTTLTGMTVSPNLYTAPDGLTTMDGAVEDGISTQCYLYWTPSAITPGTTMTNSVFISKTGRRYWQIGCGGVGDNFGAVLDTLTGVITSSGANGTNVFSSARVEDIGGAWRVSITGLLNFTVPYLLVIATDSPTWVSGLATISPATNTTGIWGAQVE